MSDEDEFGNGLRTFIAKPEGSCQGWGIFIFRDLEEMGPTD